MNLRTLRAGILALSALLVVVGLSTAPATTAAAGTVVTICNSTQSRNDVYGDFRVIDSARGYTFWLSDGECVTVSNTSTLRVDKFGATIPQGWRVRTVGGDYSACHFGESNPGSASKYIYWVANC